MTEEVDLNAMKRVVENYIFEKKGRRIQIVFDDLMNMRRHFQMLSQAYDFVRKQQNNK
jgi:ribosomal protein S2